MTATANRAGGREPLEERLKERAPLVSECLTLVFSSDASLAEHLDSIDLVFREVGDPLKKVWIEDEAGRTKSVAADQAIAWLRQHPGFRTYAAMPESERGNDRATWLSSERNGLQSSALPQDAVSGNPVRADGVWRIRDASTSTAVYPREAKNRAYLWLRV